MFSKLPPPTTFSEGMRLVFSIAAMAFAICCGLGLVALCSILIWGNWPAQYYGQILSILGFVAIGALVLLGITQAGQLLGGPVGRFKADAEIAGNKVGIEGSGANVPADTVAAAAQGAAAGAVSAASKPTGE
jgi:hypothetical protein